jgi:YggT family protein
MKAGISLGITELLLNILSIYSFVLFGRAIMSWFDPGFRSTIGRILYDITEPVVAPVRQVVPSLGGLDLSIMVTLFLILILQRLLSSAL